VCKRPVLFCIVVLFGGGASVDDYGEEEED
jgi:hypothetical protein